VSAAPPLTAWRARRAAGGIAELVAAKAATSIAVCIPARDEGATIGGIVRTISGRLMAAGLVDELVVVDDGSDDDTGIRADAAGARVIRCPEPAGKGGALRCAVDATRADIVVFVDGDVVNFPPWFVVSLVAPLVEDPSVMMVKAGYGRPLHGQRGEGGRVTEILARPLLERFYPELADIAQPLAGEFAVRREVLDEVTLADGYAVDIALLIDVWERFGRQAIAEVDLGERTHRNRPLRQLRPHSRAVLDAVLDRAASRELHP
jgi:glucosyl-3-phosphoglycerate synthase